MEQNAASLLNGVMGIIKDYEEKWRKTGEQYNIFKVAGIAHKEVIMCRVLADLMNPQGKHCQGSRYLSLFWETVGPKLRGCPALDIERTKVTAEYVIDENRRIDIVLNDGKIFVPIEAKIWAGDQPRQAADYFAYAQAKNRGVHVPVLYLTLGGHEPSDSSKTGMGKEDCVCISFKNEILAWLEACVRQGATETTIPIRENLRQLIAAVKSLCGKSEDVEMEDAIFKLVTQSDDSVRAALAISGVLDFDGRAQKAFKERIVPLVRKVFPDAEYLPHEDGWDFITIPLKGSAYCLDLNYDWKFVQIGVPENNAERNAQVEKYLAQQMTGWTHHVNEGAPVFALWGTNRYPGLESVDDALYSYKLCKEYIEYPQEAADRIISIAKALESA
jgi:hypothetical protein